MRSRLSASLAAVVGTLMLSAPALAVDWSDFESAFPAFPCQDGWMGCLVDGDVVSPNLRKDRDNMLVPADMRLGWFDLEPTASFSPFVGLSEYTGVLEVASAEPEEPEPSDPGPVAVADPEPSDPRPSDPGPSAPRVDPGPRDPGPRTDPGRRTDPGPVAVSTPRDPGPRTDGGHRPTTVTPPASDPTPRTTTTVEPAAVASADDPKTPPADAPVMLRPKDPAPAAGDDSCDDLKAIEPKAMLGKLSRGQEECLESSIGESMRQTDKDKMSRILMTNAYSSGNRAKWEKLIKRHLDEIDRSDPDLCYKYALHLSKGGAGRADGTIRWADVALENKSVWTGTTYTNRVYSLYKLKAAAAQSLWQAAEAKHSTAPTPQTKAGVDSSRNQTKTFAREWYEYAKSAGKDETVALQLCTSAAGTKEYCQGG